MQATDAGLFILQCVILVRLLTVQPANEKGFDFALRWAGQTLLGLKVSLAALVFAALTRKARDVQKWFLWVSLVTTIGWGLLLLLASAAV